MIDQDTIMMAMQVAPLAVVEFRSGGEEQEIRWSDPKTGQSKTGMIRRFTCEMGTQPCLVALPKSCVADDSLGVDAPLVRGSRYLISVSSVEPAKGVLHCTGLFLCAWPPNFPVADVTAAKRPRSSVFGSTPKVLPGGSTLAGAKPVK